MTHLGDGELYYGGVQVRKYFLCLIDDTHWTFDMENWPLDIGYLIFGTLDI